MGKTRDLFKKVRDTKGTFHAKIGTIKDRNGIDLTEAEDVKKIKSECQKNTENDYGLVVELGVKTVFTIYFKHCKTIDTDAHGDIIIINVCDFFSLCGSYSNRNKCWNERKNTYFQDVWL